MNGVRDRFRPDVDFVFVYIAEAHPAEKKHYENENVRKIFAHKSFEDRIVAAEILLDEAGADWTLLIDDMDDRANIDYAAHPDRIYVIRNGKIAFEGKIGPFGFDPKVLEAHLEKMLFA